MMQQRLSALYLMLMLSVGGRRNVASGEFLLNKLLRKVFKQEPSLGSGPMETPLPQENQRVKEQESSLSSSRSTSRKEQQKRAKSSSTSTLSKSSISSSKSSSSSEEDEEDEEDGDQSQDEPIDNLDFLEKLGILQVKLALHRNGEATPCGSVSTLSRTALTAAMEKVDSQNDGTIQFEGMDEYEIEAFLTALFLESLHPGACGSIDDNTRASSFAGYCDMGPERTVVQQDYDQLMRVDGGGTVEQQGEEKGSLPCRFYTREGLRVHSLETLAAITTRASEHSRSCFVNHFGQEECSTPTLDLYAVPAGRVFMFAPKFVGEKFVIDHVEDSVGEKFVMEVLSLEPRVFELFNFFTLEEADQLIERALSETDELLKLHRSTTNTGLRGASVVSRRTSDNSWDIQSDVAIRMKSRCLQFLGFDEYNGAYADGLQIARFQETQGYDTHQDYMDPDDSNSMYNFDTSTVGGNRFATIIMHLTDLEENAGGETLFPSAFPPGKNDESSTKEIIRELRASGRIDALAPGSWEEEMTALSRTRLTVPPKKGRAIMFYLQHPNGKQDMAALNGACPVLNGTKWDATLWGWSAPSPDNPGAPLVQKQQAWW